MNNKEHEYNYVYESRFKLTNPLNPDDFITAYQYLQDDDMTKYLIADLSTPKNKAKFKNLYKEIREIVWVLETVDTGKIMLFTTKELTKDETTFISKWISGQCSDGLGEGLENQDFSNGDNRVRFDWQSNKYELRKVSKDEDLESFIK